MTDIPPHKPQTAPQMPPSQIKRPALIFDWRDWLPYFEHSDAPLEQKRIWIETMHSIVLSFVDLGFEIKSTSEICGEEINLKAVLEQAVLNSEHAQPDTDDQPTDAEDAA